MRGEGGSVRAASASAWGLREGFLEEEILKEEKNSSILGDRVGTRKLYSRPRVQTAYIKEWRHETVLAIWQPFLKTVFIPLMVLLLYTFLKYLFWNGFQSWFSNHTRKSLLILYSFNPNGLPQLDVHQSCLLNTLGSFQRNIICLQKVLRLNHY